jgi:pimeloyl-ACP methyl ester carboxylesterase
MNELVIRADGVELATQSFGDPAQPPILLIMGGMASMLWWPEEFCRRLAARGRFVIRYDQRDSGLSTKYPPGRPGYGFDDAVEDALRVLDGYRITAAHVAGFSQGGMVGQGTALKHPERVLSLTAISTSPVGVDRSSLPESDKAWLEHMAVDVDWSDRAEAVAYCLEDARLIAGTTHPFDKAETRAFIERDFDRSGGYLSATNHSVLFKIGKAWQGRLHAARHSRHRRSNFSGRARDGAFRGRSGCAALEAQGRRARAEPRRLGPDRRGDRRTHGSEARRRPALTRLCHAARSGHPTRTQGRRQWVIIVGCAQ